MKNNITISLTDFKYSAGGYEDKNGEWIDTPPCYKLRIDNNETKKSRIIEFSRDLFNKKTTLDQIYKLIETIVNEVK